MSLKNEYRCIGRLVADPEYVEQANKTKFRIAINERYKKEKIVTFMNCVAFGNISKYIRDYVRKGDLVTLRGPMRTYTYETRDGERRNEINVLIDEIERLSYNGSNESRPNPKQEQDRYKWKTVDWSNKDVPKWNNTATSATPATPAPQAPPKAETEESKQNDFPWRNNDPDFYFKGKYDPSNDYDPF